MIDESLLIQVTLMIQFICWLLQHMIQCIDSMSWIIYRYDAVRQVIIKFTSKLIKLTRITVDCIGISSNSCPTLDIMTSINNSLFFKIFSNYNVIGIKTGWFVDVLIDCQSNIASLCILIQFMIKVGLNSSLSLSYNILYLITVNNTISKTTDETIVETFFSVSFFFFETQTKDSDNSDNSSLIMTVKNNFECWNGNSIQSSSTSKKLIDISSLIINNNQSYIAVYQRFFVFVLDINVTDILY